MTVTQGSIAFDWTGTQLRDAGIRLASENAEAKEPGWNEQAYELLKTYLKGVGKFKTEDFRGWAEQSGLAKPPSARAYGGVILCAAKHGLIKKVGHITVENPKAHACYASLWETVKC